ncbi:hypothetical protein [Kineosporia sp. A_224]|uniref:hypothetical protein n=1 Tax=Kineosporia sp. A_224 TaxID=1962180 RepID=UPI000B4AB75F|nr:hypothetical protein [Kineosporia sp. A_224]
METGPAWGTPDSVPERAPDRVDVATRVAGVLPLVGLVLALVRRPLLTPAPGRYTWSFTARGIIIWSAGGTPAPSRGDGSAGSSTRMLRPWSHVARLEVDDLRLHVLTKDRRRGTLPTSGTDVDDLRHVVRWARAAGVEVSGEPTRV